MHERTTLHPDPTFLYALASTDEHAAVAHRIDGMLRALAPNTSEDPIVRGLPESDPLDLTTRVLSLLPVGDVYRLAAEMVAALVVGAGGYDRRLADLLEDGTEEDAAVFAFEVNPWSPEGYAERFAAMSPDADDWLDAATTTGVLPRVERETENARHAAETGLPF